MALWTEIVPVADFLKALIETNIGSLGIPAGGVYYGDQEKFDTTPSVCVETGSKVRGDVRPGRKYNVTMEIYVLVYHGGIIDTQTQRRNNDLLAEQIEALIHLDHTMKGSGSEDKVIDSVVSTSEPGYVSKGGNILRATRLTVTIQTQQFLPC